MDRYDRQTKFQPFGENGQHQLQTAKIMIMGAGALGSHVAEQLARAGAHHLTVVDMDIVEISNLHRQALYDESDAYDMRPKVVALRDKINKINQHVTLNAMNKELTPSNIEEVIKQYQPDIIVDGMDHFDIRFLINEVCHKLQIPWVYGAAVGSKGTVYAIDFEGPCLKCILENVPETGESCAINGVLPPVVNQVASFEVSEVLRYIAGKGFSKKLITLDCFEMNTRSTQIDMLKNQQCPVCVNGHYNILDKQHMSSIEALCGDAFLFRFKENTFNLAHYFPGDVLKENDYVKLISFKDYKMTFFADGRMNVHGVSHLEEAETLYHNLRKSIQ
ncbi:ThiF family adenylyltransferase [Mammaliicoccus lentus]|uniref:HesA/MoeB/ThiF family protein n=1 Tax=Mammaliicoccus lentus TaxID=42858 RepID=UPI0015F49808|nr:ThiF family adenylyltransferase [Mammaliicoccus lentus]QMU09464.1 ThiF family adenylyltransferase [Mammaliicoccus lentus]